MKKLNLGSSVIYADCARPDAIEEIYRAGFNIKPADKSKDSVVNGILQIKAMNLHILDDSPDLIKEIRNYRWMEDKNGKIVEDEPVKFLDDGMDAMRYAIYTHNSAPKGIYRIGFA